MSDKAQLGQHLRRHVQYQLYDASIELDPAGIAIYSLCDPRDIRQARYIGQSSSPRRRFLQHLNTARLWLPDERPWWIKSPKLRPLYDWIRELYREDRRLPTMVVWRWAPTATAARLAEREHIEQCLSEHQPLLNIEAERQATQPQLPWGA
ncbi:MAG TPA: GIY-YIG nuclease family protein [Steroidobacteraceae bacterium]|nr:GIY-YIG nuclease family protein [Steroidobacteraceae bacterium]